MKLLQRLRAPRPRPDLDRLRTATTVWLGTVGADGRPHLVPTWFSWDGEALWVYSKPNAVKVRNVRDEPRVTLAIGEPDDDFDVQLIEALAELPTQPTVQVIGEAHWRKYRGQLRSLRLSRAEYVETYSQPMRLRPTRFLAWHGRGPRWTPLARPTAPPAAFRALPALPALRLALR